MGVQNFVIFVLNSARKTKQTKQNIFLKSKISFLAFLQSLVKSISIYSELQYEFLNQKSSKRNSTSPDLQSDPMIITDADSNEEKSSQEMKDEEKLSESLISTPKSLSKSCSSIAMTKSQSEQARKFGDVSFRVSDFVS